MKRVNRYVRDLLFLITLDIIDSKLLMLRLFQRLNLTLEMISTMRNLAIINCLIHYF